MNTSRMRSSEICNNLFDALAASFIMVHLADLCFVPWRKFNGDFQRQRDSSSTMNSDSELQLSSSSS